MEEQIRNTIKESIRVKTHLMEDEEAVKAIVAAASACIETFRKNGKVLLCGNGGSAADAQHIAAELSGRFAFDRPPLYAEALHVNSSFVTAVANDYSYEETFARMVEAAGRKGDVLIGLSTSGNSPNVLKALARAREAGMSTIGMSGADGGKMKAYCDILIRIPSTDTARIQEAHILAGHIICGIVEHDIFKG